jgi:predicted transcriptional regulator
MDKVKKRERLEVVFDFLRIIQESHNSIRRTPLLRKTNLSSQSFAEYLDELTAKGFVREIVDGNDKRYVTLTDKGYTYLSKYATIRGFIDEFGL